MESNFQIKARVEPNGDNWNLLLYRVVEDKQFPVALLEDISGAEVYTKSGIVVPTPVIPEGSRIDMARTILRDALGKTSGTIMKTTDVDNILLDTWNALGNQEEDTNGTDTK